MKDRRKLFAAIPASMNDLVGLDMKEGRYGSGSHLHSNGSTKGLLKTEQKEAWQFAGGICSTLNSNGFYSDFSGSLFFFSCFVMSIF